MLSNVFKYLLVLLGVVLVARLIPMFIVPFFDPTEARYGEIARIMAETGDWITPFYDYGVPFWGKPPLSFWAQAAGFKIFGVYEFAPRIPAWLVTLATVGLIFYFLKVIASLRTAILGSLIYASTLLVFALAGGVLTDPYLNLAITLSLVAFALTVQKQQRYWGYLFFIGLVLGLLAKGPIAVVLIAGPAGIWLLLGTHRWRSLKYFPWFTGILLTLVLTLPWYIAAELKTPGFIEYFIVGEHFYRFVDPGWGGDLYGSAHKYPKGTIWVQWLVASLPWGVIAIALLFKHMAVRESRLRLWQQLRDDNHSFYVLWAIFPMCFFSLAGNVLWTYALPALPALAVLLALYFTRDPGEHSTNILRWLSLAALVAPVFLIAGTVYVVQRPELLPTEKYLVNQFRSVASPEDRLIFINDRSFSARYYSQGKAVLLAADELQDLLRTNAGKILYLAIPGKQVEELRTAISRPMRSLYKSNKYQLFELAVNESSAVDKPANDAVQGEQSEKQ